MRPLSDVRVVAVEQYGAGPFGSLHLAELGADVIKVEDPHSGGDIGRYVPPFQEGEDSLFFETFNAGKRSVNLDLGCEAGRAVFEDLVEVSDIVYSNLRGDVPERLRIRYDDLKHRNPAIVCCSLTGFGMTGPRRDQPGYDYILQGMAGWMSLTGEPDGPPTKTGLSLVDLSGGFVAAIAMLAGVHAARRDGVGGDCDLSLFDVAIGMLNYPATWFLTEGLEPQRTSLSSHPSLVPFQNFRTADGWIVVACPKEKFWHRLCHALDRPDLIDDDRFADFPSRSQHRDELVDVVGGILAGGTTEHWLAQLSGGGVPVGPVNSLAEAFEDPHVQAREMVVESAHPRFGSVRRVASPVRVGARSSASPRAPRRNEDADGVLGELLGYSSARRADLTDAGAFGRV